MNQNPNPMWWDCDKHGCFNQKKRMPIEQFNPCFSRGINFGDVDAEVEAGRGRVLKIEFKDGRKIGEGQIASYRNQTKVNHITVFQVDAVAHGEGCARTIGVNGYRVIQFGRVHAWKEADFEGLKKAIRAWFVWADNSPQLPEVTEPEFANKSQVHKRYREDFEVARGAVEQS